MKKQNKVSSILLICTLGLSVLIAAVTVDMVNPVLGNIGQELGGSEAQVSWVVSGVALVLSISIPFYGKLSDFLNIKKLYINGLLMLSIGSLICILANNLVFLVLGRMVQGAGMAAIPVLSVVIISKIYPPGKIGSILGIIAACIGVGTAGGPIFGGFIGQILGWQSLFVITFILSLVIVLGAYISLPNIDSDKENMRQTFDVLGGVLLGLTVGSFLLGVTFLEMFGLFSKQISISFFISIITLFIFIYRVKNIENSFIPLFLIKNRMYRSSVLVVFLSMFAYFSMLVFIPLLVVEINGLSTGQAGLILLPGGIAVALLSPIVGRFSDKVSPSKLLIIGLIIMSVSSFYMSFIAGASPYLFSIGSFGIGIAFAFINSPVNNIAVIALSKEQIGVGTGLFQGALYLGAGTGASLIGSLLTMRHGTESSFNPIYNFNVPHYSDIFLVITFIVISALIIALKIKIQNLK
ncbi:MFS transporter [Staphylococcus arlettae]|uniref:MFS transporter n=1 Tax=Staphylococcus arlettae TaxID=29378 RepID=UPI00065FC675|nr:MFS transporter [Staphylococcus arlettae]RIM58895.1 MFS transporter [Staphylococcus arlettae]